MSGTDLAEGTSFVPEWEVGSVTDGFDVSKFKMGVSGTDLMLIYRAFRYVDFALTPNQTNVASALDEFVGAGGDRDAVAAQLDALADNQFPAAFDQIMPGIYSELPSHAFRQANAFHSALFQNLWLARGQRGASDVSVSTPVSSSKGGTVVAEDPLLDERWSSFIQGNGQFGDGGNRSDLQEWDSDSGGLAAGMSYAWSDVTSTGLYLGYQDLNVDYGARSGIDDEAVRFGAHGNYSLGDFYVNALLGAAVHDYSVNRNISFSGLDREARSSTDALELNAVLGTGYDWNFGNSTFGSYANLQYSRMNVDGFEENGADSLDLRVSDYDSDSLLSTLGVQLSHRVVLSREFTIKPMIHAGWQHEFLQDGYPINAAFFNGGPALPFRFDAPSMDADFLFTGAGLGFECGRSWNGSLLYNTALADDDQNSHSLFLTIGRKF
jgi:outer membrane autotransporter protein